MNFVAAMMAIPLLKFFGRRTILVGTYTAQTVFLFIQYWTHSTNQDIALVMCILFVTAFEFGPGPVTWLYQSEVCTRKSQSAAVSVNWFGTLVIGAVSPMLITHLGGYTFFVFSINSLIAAIFCFLFVKESKGLSDVQLS